MHVEAAEDGAFQFWGLGLVVGVYDLELRLQGSSFRDCDLGFKAQDLDSLFQEMWGWCMLPRYAAEPTARGMSFKTAAST